MEFYADDYNGKIVNANTHAGERGAWVHWEDTMSESEKIRNVETGALFRYVLNKHV